MLLAISLLKLSS
jgi:uncharacterized protein YlxW (UPF0749 family)